MKKILGFLMIPLLLCSLFVISAPVMATDTLSIVDITLPRIPGWSRGVRIIRWTYSSDDGTVGADADYIAEHVTGTIIGFKHEPDGTNTPDSAADYDILDAVSSGMNVLFDAGDNIGASRTIVVPVEAVNSGPVFVADEALYFYATALGAGTNAGVFEVYILLP